MDVMRFFDAVVRQNAAELRSFFWSDAQINWHCTNERFTVEEYLRANCEYPGQWSGGVERIEETGDRIVAVTRVFSETQSCHAVSFLRIKEDRIAQMDEYWGDDGPPPLWRAEKHIGTQILPD